MWNDNASKVDLLFFKPYSKIIKNISLAKSNSPDTIGLFGSWGSGKSTILELLKEEIEAEDGSIYIKLNAWLLENYEDAKIAVIEGLLTSLEENKTFVDKVGDEIKSLLKRVNLFKVGKYLFNKGVSLIPFVKTDDSLKLTDIIEESDSDYIRNIRIFRSDFEQAIIKSTVKKIIVAIDDLDRCDPLNIIEILEAIKLFLSVQGVTFIIAIDNEILETSVKIKYNIIE